MKNERPHPSHDGGTPVDQRVGRLPANAQKPHIRRLMSGGWLCDGANLGGTAWTPAGAYRAWLWNMVHNGEPHQLAEYGLTA